jgi:hypothetical protein
MPGLRLTLEQAQRLCGIERALCRAVLDALVADRFLCVKSNGMYARLTHGDPSRSRSIEADIETVRCIATAS